MSTIDSVSVWKTYINYLKRLKEVASQEYRKVPAVLNAMNPDEVQHLRSGDIEALQAMQALPPSESLNLSPEELGAARAYVLMLHKLKGDKKEWEKVPAVLRLLSEEEARNLGGVDIQALRLLGVFPEGLFPAEKPGLDVLNEALNELCRTDPELSKLAARVRQTQDPQKAHQLVNHPKITAFMASRPDLQKILNDEVRRQQELFLGMFMRDIFGDASQGKKLTGAPYSAHPYGAADSAAPPPIGQEIGWLLGFP